MRSLRASSLILCVTLVLAACSTFPTEQLSFDESQSKVPVMLTKVASDSPTKDFDFEAGHSHTTVTAQNRYSAGGTSTVSMGMDSSKPINQQLSNFFLQDPQWVLVKNLSISVDHNIWNFVFVGIDKYTYTTGVKLAVAAGSAK